MMIDPWGINNISLYTNGLCAGLAEHTDLTLYTNYYYEKSTETDYTVKKWFFKISEKMPRGNLRKLMRGIEYINIYRKIIKDLKVNSYDVIHIQWLLFYDTDIYYLKIIKQYCKKLVITAHNIVPHTSGAKYVKKLNKIYGIVDIIILHGKGILNEFEVMFPEFKDKVVIQKHGTYLNQNTKYNLESIELRVIEKVNKYDKAYIFFGKMYYSKGVDRLAKIWIDHFQNQDNQLLIIAGKKSKSYKELDALEEGIIKCKNTLYLNKFVENNLLNYLINQSQLIILPYRHASMSGVIFTAAEFKKPVLCTDTGSISEYLVDEDNSFISENRDDSFCEKFKYISNEVDKEVLQSMGIRLHAHINKTFSWEKIGRKLVESAYK